MATPLEEYLQSKGLEPQPLPTLESDMDKFIKLMNPPPPTSPELTRSTEYARDARLDPTYAGSPEAWRAGLGLATPDYSGAQNPFGQAAQAYTPGTAGKESPSEPIKPPPTYVPPQGPSQSDLYDMQKGLLDRTLASQLEGFGEQRSLVDQLANIREQGLLGQERFAQDLAADRQEFLEEADIRRAEQEEAARVEREQRLTQEMARQQTQLNTALEAVGVDVDTATLRLESLGIDPGSFAGPETSETTAMLYSQTMSAANMVNQLDEIAIQSATFAKNANDQASAAAMYGIKEDLAFAMQSINQARIAGQMDDAQALQAIADAERAAREGYDAALTGLDVQTAQEAIAAAAAASKAQAAAAKEYNLLAAGVLAQQAILKAQRGEPLTLEEQMAVAQVDQSSDLYDASSEYINWQTGYASDQAQREQDLFEAGYKAYLGGTAGMDAQGGFYPLPSTSSTNGVQFVNELGQLVTIPYSSISGLSEANAYDQLGAFAPFVTPATSDR